MNFKTHEALDIIPLMTEEEFQGLKQDISENGQCEDIVVWKGLLIDGRARLRACEELGRTPDIAELDEDQDPIAFCEQHNLYRQHLTKSQYKAVLKKISK